MANWNIKAECEDGKKVEFEVIDGRFYYVGPTVPPNRKSFTETELATIRNMAKEMDDFKYVKMECTRL